MNFSDFNFDPQIVEGLDSMGYKSPTPVQELAIPFIQQGKDVIACAQTGTGKTAAYLLPVLDQLMKRDNSTQIDTLVLVPTRELALQIDQQLSGLAYFLGVSSIPIYGGGDGSSWDQQKNAVINGVDIIIATPGRLIQHLNLGYVNLSHLKHLILDEADRMLDMGFFDDIMRINRELPFKRQTLMFSATMPPKIRELAQRLLVEPELINIAISKPAAGIVQEAYVVYDGQKVELLPFLLRESNFTSVIIFSSTKSNVKVIEEALRRNDFSVKAIHSDLEQADRERVLLSFRNRETNILVATDVLSRGIDIVGIDLVINYDIPGDAEDYVHRVGRTARAASTGKAITFISEKDQRKFQRIEKLIGYEVKKMPLPEQLGEGPAYEPDKKSFDRGHKGKKPGKKRNSSTPKSGKPASELAGPASGEVKASTGETKPKKKNRFFHKKKKSGGGNSQ